MRIKICPKCQAQNGESARTCASCGGDLRSVRPKVVNGGTAPAQPDLEKEQEASKETVTTAMPSKICPSCQHRNPVHKSKCDACGESLMGVMISEPEPPVRPSSATALNTEALSSTWLISSDNICRIRLQDGEVILGRERTAQEYLASKTYAGRTHARITKMGDVIVVEDLNSTNGTYVNGERVPAGANRMLKEGDVLGLGGNHPSQVNAAFFKVITE